jgi:hypothetical protein
VRTNLGWSFRKATGAARKLPNNWEQLGLLMAQRTAYLVKAYSIPPSMLVNTDQTGIHMVPSGGARTWAEKGSKHVLVHGMEDKRQITCSVSSTAAGNLLLFQLIFTGTIDRCLPPRNVGRQVCEEEGWHLTCSNNHWSNLATCKDFVGHILEPYRQKQAKEMGLEKSSKLIWLLDCWSVQMSKEFISWLKEMFPNILLIFVPANCTSIFQPTDVILQRPFKHSFRQQFDEHTSQDIGKQLEEKDVHSVKLDTKMSILKPLLCTWLHEAWKHINQPIMIKKGWAMCGLDKAFNQTFQINAMDENMRNPLFKEDPIQLEINPNDKKDDIDTDIHVDIIMSEGLSRAAEITTKNSKSSMSILRDLARKR